ncbi:hypothetical protein [Micromonospora zingiberis]|nr:hypothetical protein [Micromonospora zingiberis]
MIRPRILAVLLLLIAFVALALSKAFPFLEDFPEVAKTAIAAGGAACALAGVSLWFRKKPEQSSPQSANDGETA